MANMTPSFWLNPCKERRPRKRTPLPRTQPTKNDPGNTRRQIAPHSPFPECRLSASSCPHHYHDLAPSQPETTPLAVRYSETKANHLYPLSLFSCADLAWPAIVPAVNTMRATSTINGFAVSGGRSFFVACAIRLRKAWWWRLFDSYASKRCPQSSHSYARIGFSCPHDVQGIVSPNPLRGFSRSLLQCLQTIASGFTYSAQYGHFLYPSPTSSFGMRSKTINAIGPVNSPNKNHGVFSLPRLGAMFEQMKAKTTAIKSISTIFPHFPQAVALWPA